MAPPHEGRDARRATAVISIVLNWNRCADTLQCLEALVGQSAPGCRHDVLLVDNGSTDGSVGAVRSAYPQVDVLPLPENLGYARAMNAGIQRALSRGADWTLLVNNDTEAEPGLLARLMRATGDAGVGLVTPTIVYADDPDRVWPSAGWRRRLTLAAFDVTSCPPRPTPYDVEWATGCCLLVRRGVWEQVGLFDERYRFFYEDHDLCLRARASDWRIVHVPAARIRHRVSASTGEGSPRKLYLLARSSVPYYLTHTRGVHRIFIIFYRLGSLVRTLVATLLAGRLDAGRAYLRGLFDGLRDFATGPHQSAAPCEDPAPEPQQGGPLA